MSGTEEVRVTVVSALQIEPGKCYMIQLPGVLGEEAAHRLQVSLEELCPGSRFVVLEEGARLVGVEDVSAPDGEG